MFSSVYSFNKQQKRNFPDDDPIYVPTLKKTRLWDENLLRITQQNDYNVNLADMSFLGNESPNSRVVSKPNEYFPAVCIDVNDTFENNMMDQTKFKYMPDLNAAQNPHYYEYNKLLFELYLERIRRCKTHDSSSSHDPPL